jgi:hypothetical protein
MLGDDEPLRGYAIEQAQTLLLELGGCDLSHAMEYEAVISNDQSKGMNPVRVPGFADPA